MAAVVSLGEILQLPLELKQGSDIAIALTVLDATGAPITNPTGWTARAQIRSTPGGVVLFEWNTTTGPGLGTAVLTYDSVANVSTLTLGVTAAQSLGFTWNSALYDVLLTNPSGKTACVAEGTVTIDPIITQ